MNNKNHKNATHGFISNLRFMLNEQWEFEKKRLFITFIHILSVLIVAQLGIWLPKVVLDSIGTSVSSDVFSVRILGLTTLFMLFAFINHYTEQSIVKGAVKILNMRFYIEKDWKVLDMDYSLSTSKEGKMKIKKAHSAISYNVYVNMASFYINLVDLTKSICGLFSFCAVLFLLHPLIILLLLCTYLLDGICTVRMQRWEHGLKEERARIERKLDYVLGDINDSFMAKDIKVYAMSDWIHNTTECFIREKETLERKIEEKHTRQRLIEACFTFVRNGGAYLYLLWKMFHTDMTIGDFTLYFGAITGFGQWLNQIVLSVNGLSNANYRVDDYRNLIETKDRLRRTKGMPLPDLSLPVELTLEQVSFRYDGSEELILNNISYTMKRGEKIAIVGNNGAGKTTLIKLICGLLEPVSGRILLNEVDIRDYNRDEYYRLISAVFQNICILPTSIAKNIGYAPDMNIDKEKLLKSITLAGLDQKIRTLQNGMDTELVPSVVDGGVDLSGGEMQKLMLARAIYKDAPLLILDEPTAALDPIAEREMYLKYNELTKNRTSIYISHRLSSTRFCDTILYLEDGKIVESGSHDELMLIGGKYKALYEIQSQYYQKDRKGAAE